MTIHDPHYVYEMFGPDAEPLYVGVTVGLASRLQSHIRADWWPTVEILTASRYLNQRQALAEEARRIQQYSPTFNLSGTNEFNDDRARRHRERRLQLIEARHAQGFPCLKSYGCRACTEQHKADLRLVLG